ncbi:MAG TPA: hypothetical protein VJV79_06385 [Polyangiaceae bacterium]|nr:hypothetical protein [Polyangiaceae bacterium]
MKAISLFGLMLATALGALTACSHGRPANDGSSTNGSDAIAPSGNAPTGHSRPKDEVLGTDMTPEPSNAASKRDPPTSSGGSKTNSTDSGSTSH